MAKSKKETRKKPPAHEVIVREIGEHIKGATEFYNHGGIARFFFNGVYIKFFGPAALIKVLLKMHIPDQARRETAKAIYDVLVHFKRMGLHGRHIRDALGGNPSEIRARIQSGRR